MSRYAILVYEVIEEIGYEDEPELYSLYDDKTEANNEAMRLSKIDANCRNMYEVVEYN